MPRTVQEIVDHADELASRFESADPAVPVDGDNEVLVVLRQAVMSRSAVERAIAELVAKAYGEGHSWRSIGELLGTSGEAARQRYGVRRPTTSRKSGSSPGAALDRQVPVCW